MASWMAEAGLDEGTEKLRQLERENDTWTAPSRQLCYLYMSLEAFDKALQHIETALSRAKTITDRVDLELRRVDVLIKLKRGGETLKQLYELISETPEVELRSRVYEKLADVYETFEDSCRSTRSLERALILCPENKSVRFRLAWKYGQSNETVPDAVYHYRVLTKLDERYGSAVNNLAAELQKLGLIGTPIKLWKKASEFDWPYPSGNLGIELADAGFYEEGLDRLEKLAPEYRNESRALEASAHIKKQKEKEEKEYDNIIRYANMRRKYLQKELEASDNIDLRQIPHEQILGEWKSETGIILSFDEVAKGGSIRAEYKTTQAVYNLTGNRTDVLFVLTAKQTKTKSYGGLLGIGQAGLSDPGQWLDVYSNPDEFVLRLVLQEQKYLVGFKVKNDRVFEELKFNR